MTIKLGSPSNQRMISSHSFARFLSFCAILWLLHGVVRGQSFSSVEEALRHWEGKSLTPYQDNGSSVSVGIGHNLTALRDSARDLYTDAQVEAFFEADVANALRICRKGVEDFDGLPERVKQVAINVAFCCGSTGFMRFVNFRKALSWRAYNLASVELGHSKWFHTVSAKRANWAFRILRYAN